MNEYQRGVGGELVEYSPSNVYPAVHEKLTKSPLTIGEFTFNIRSQEGNYVDKIVNVTNTGNEDAYVRTVIAVPNMNGYDDNPDATENPLHWNYLDATDNGGVGWVWNTEKDATSSAQSDKVADVTIDGVEYDLYIATYNRSIAAEEVTIPSLVGFYLDNSVDYDEEGYFSVQNGKRINLAKWMKVGDDGRVTMKILVATQACQVAGFNDAWEALDECFGDITATNHPWATTTP
jgi:hypothetical protein